MLNSGIISEPLRKHGTNDRGGQKGQSRRENGAHGGGIAAVRSRRSTAAKMSKTKV